MIKGENRRNENKVETKKKIKIWMIDNFWKKMRSKKIKLQKKRIKIIKNRYQNKKIKIKMIDQIWEKIWSKTIENGTKKSESKLLI